MLPNAAHLRQILAIFLLWVSTHSAAQTQFTQVRAPQPPSGSQPSGGLPPVLADLDPVPFPPSCGPTPPLKYLKELDESASKFFWAKTQRNHSGYLEVEVDVEYMNVIAQLFERSNQRTDPDAFGGDLKRVGLLVESPNRQTEFFEKSPGVRAMLTRWSFKRDGASLCIPLEFINAEVRGGRATLSLAQNFLRTSQVIWKLRWLTKAEDVQFELYVEDALHYGQLTESRKTLLQLAEELTRL